MEEYEEAAAGGVSMAFDDTTHLLPLPKLTTMLPAFGSSCQNIQSRLFFFFFIVDPWRPYPMEKNSH